MNLSNEKIIDIFKKKGNLYKDKDKDVKVEYQKYIGMILDFSNIVSISFKAENPITSIEFLSLINNSLNDISFLRHLPSLYYLDLYKNSIDDFEPLNYKHVLGYLRISVDYFNEKKLLQIRQLNAAIVTIEIEDKTFLKPFLLYNPNIIILNNEIVYYYKDSVLKKEGRKFQKLSSLVQAAMNENNALRTSDKILKTGLYMYEEINIETIKCKELIELNKHFIHYSKEISPLFPRVNEITNNEKYLQLEKEKLIVLSSVYRKINQYYREFLNEDAFYFLSRVNELKSTMKKKGKIASFDYSIFIQGSIRENLLNILCFLFQILGIVSEQLCSLIINFILVKYFPFTNKKYVPFELNAKTIKVQYLAIYYQIYKQFRDLYEEKVKESKSIIQNNQQAKYQKLIEALEMNSLVLQGNYLNNNNFPSYLNEENSENHLTKKKTFIKDKITMLTELQIKNEVLMLIQYLFDFIIFDKVEELLYHSKSITDYAFLIEFKDSLYQHSDITFTISDKKYNQTQIESFNNFFFFKKENADNQSKMYKTQQSNSNLFDFMNDKREKKHSRVLITEQANRTARHAPSSSMEVSYKMQTRKKVYNHSRTNRTKNLFINYDDDYIPVDAFNSDECMKVAQVDAFLNRTRTNIKNQKSQINQNINNIKENYYRNGSILPMIIDKKPHSERRKMIELGSISKGKEMSEKKKRIKEIKENCLTTERKKVVKVKINKKLFDENSDHILTETPVTINKDSLSSVKIKKRGTLIINKSRGSKLNGLNIIRNNRHNDLNTSRGMTIKELISLINIKPYNENQIRERIEREKDNQSKSKNF